MIEQLKPWGVYEFPWGTAVKHIKGDWEKVFIGAIKIDVSKLNVILTDEGIFIKGGVKMNNKKMRTCEKCANKITMAEGGIICDLNNEIVVDDYTPTDKYLWCNGKMYEKE